MSWKVIWNLAKISQMPLTISGVYDKKNSSKSEIVKQKSPDDLRWNNPDVKLTDCSRRSAGSKRDIKNGISLCKNPT